MLQTIQQTENCNGQLKQIVLQKLNPKQVLILNKVKRFEGVNVSFLVLALKEELQCTDSALWKTIRSLRELNLLENSSSITLTETGRFLLVENKHDSSSGS